MDINWKATLKKIAPLAATMIGGPWGGLAAAAIGAALGKDDATEQDIAKLLPTATPEQLVAIRKADADLKVKLKELDIKQEELVYTDKDSARGMQKEVRSAMPGILAIALTLGFFSALGTLMKVAIPEANSSIVYLMLGSLGTAWIGATQFYFGTTQSSSDKNKLLAGGVK